MVHRISRIGLAVTAAAVAAAVSACSQGANNTNNAPQPPVTDTAAQSASSSAGSAGSAGSTGGSLSQAKPASSDDVAAGTAAGTNGLCKSADLRLSFGGGDAAAGTVYRSLVFTNVSTHSCVIQGFPGVSYVGGDDGHQVGPAADRTGTKGAAITLDKGDSAFATVGFVHVENFDPGVCQPQPVRGLRVYPPQETASMYIDMPGTGCGSDHIPGDQLTVKTIEKGTGS